MTSLRDQWLTRAARYDVLAQARRDDGDSCGAQDFEDAADDYRLAAEHLPDDAEAFPTCPMCGGEPVVLGKLGREECYRCRDCGTDYYRRDGEL